MPCKWAGHETHLRADGSSTAMRGKDGKVGAWNHAGQPTQEFRIPDSVVEVTRQRGRIGEGIDHPAVFPLGGLKAGLLICYDVEFPETVRHLASSEADLILVPTALPASEHAGFIARSIIPVRAFENQVFVAYANHAGRDAAFSYAGLSGIAAPDGSDLARAPATGTRLLIADLDPSAFGAARAANPYLIDRRMRFISGPNQT